MSTETTVTFAANDGGFNIGAHFYGPPAELGGSDFKAREPVAWAAAQEFLNNGTTSGVVTITAV